MSSDDVLCNSDLGFMPAMPYTGENFGTDADFEPDAVPAAEDDKQRLWQQDLNEDA